MMPNIGHSENIWDSIDGGIRFSERLATDITKFKLIEKKN